MWFVGDVGDAAILPVFCLDVSNHASTRARPS